MKYVHIRKDKTFRGFYEKCNWKLINPEQVTLADFLKGIHTMVYNTNQIKTIEYCDRNFRRMSDVTKQWVMLN